MRALTVLGAPAKLTAYPNPAHGPTRLSGAAPGAEVRVYNATGRLLASTRATAAGTAAGICLLRAGRQALRLVVE